MRTRFGAFNRHRATADANDFEVEHYIGDTAPPDGRNQTRVPRSSWRVRSLPASQVFQTVRSHRSVASQSKTLSGDAGRRCTQNTLMVTGLPLCLPPISTNMCRQIIRVHTLVSATKIAMLWRIQLSRPGRSPWGWAGVNECGAIWHGPLPQPPPARGGEDGTRLSGNQCLVGVSPKTHRAPLPAIGRARQGPAQHLGLRGSASPPAARARLVAGLAMAAHPALAIRPVSP